jgi:Putative zinc-finger
MGARPVEISMDHAYIDANSVAERYLDHALSPEDLRAFEEHIVDCQECADRLLLAEMFHARNGHKPKADPRLIARVVLYKPQRVVAMLIAAALAIPLVYLLVTFVWSR